MHLSKLKSIIRHVGTICLAVLLTLAPPTPVNIAHADTTNADGSITKTATNVGFAPCDGKCNDHTSTSICKTCGYNSYTTVSWSCEKCGYSSSFSFCGKESGSPSNPTAHVRSVYANSAYGYSGVSSSFCIWPINVTANDGITYSLSINGATATDAAIKGKTVTLMPSGASDGTKIKITNSGTDETVTQTIADGTYTFTMPAKVTTITLDLAKQSQTVNSPTSFSRTYNQSSFNINAYVT